MFVIISNAETAHIDTGEKIQHSTLYHYAKREWQCHSARAIKEPIEVEERLAKAFGRTLCGLCTSVRQRRETLDQLEHLAKVHTSTGDLSALLGHLPDNIEVRFYAHGFNKTPYKIWSNYDD